MKWRVRLGENEHRVEVQPRAPGGEVRVTVDGKPVAVDAFAADQGGLSLIIDGRSFTIDFDRRGSKVALLVAHGEQILVQVAVEDERRGSSATGASRRSHEGPQAILAPMPGKVVRVLVKVGEEVKAEQGLLIVEAMKMENELKAPQAGRVSEILVREGVAVEGGQKLCVLE